MDSEEIVAIEFGVMSDEDILASSACEIRVPSYSIESGSVYDPRLGCIENNSECETCLGNIWTCPGHFGHIDLHVPIILFHKQVVSLLKCFCHECFKLLATAKELKLNSIYGFDRSVNFLSGLASCAHCKTPSPDIKFSLTDCSIIASHKHKQKKASFEMTPELIKTIFDQVSDEDVKLLGLKPELVRPRNFVLTKFQVVPTCCRPKMHAGDNVSDDDLTLLLIEILKNNAYIATNPLESAKTDKEKAAFEKAVIAVRMKALAYCDNTRSRAIHTTNHKPMTGIKERIDCKKGLMRQNLTGKRCDRTARTVIGPDPTLKIDEIAIPEEIANILTIPIIVNTYNREELTRLVNSGKASTIIKRDGSKINVRYARLVRGTNLEHSDTIVREGKEIPVTNCKMVLKEDDIVKKIDGTSSAAILPSFKDISLDLGDKVERYLQNRDDIYVNRQPTLHRNSMLGMKVAIKKGRTIRFNLSITKGLNADFDGDEANIFCCQTLESRAELAHLVNVKEHMLSAQTNKPEQSLVQDSLLAAYLMTKEPVKISRENFYNCLMKLTNPKFSVPERELFASDLFEFILPKDFYVSYPAPSNLKIEKGKVVSGYFDKASLGTGKNAIVRLLRLEYGKTVAATFIDDVQFLTNAWLEQNPFSIGIEDCLIDENSVAQVKKTVERYFAEANVIGKSIRNAKIKEFRVNMTLNKAKDLGLKIAKESFQSSNNFLGTVISGSKGDFFNIAQITGLLGQQNLSNQRPVPMLTNGSRTLVHYPFVISNIEQKFESRGFVSSSFLKGLSPKEMWFHASTGREGMINTAMKTARSGYLQRSCVKLNEDITIEYDGTVRDAGKTIHQFAYGHHGFDPSLVTFKNGEPFPIDVERLARRLNVNSEEEIEPLIRSQIDEIVEECEWKRQIPEEIFDEIWTRHERNLRKELEKTRLIPKAFSSFKNEIVEKYHTARACPGECVGIIGAESIGEVQTQSNLNTFHTAGKLQSSGIERFEEILNMTKETKFPYMNIFFTTRFTSAKELREQIGNDFVGLKLKDLMLSLKPSIISEKKKLVLRFALKKSIMFKNYVCPEHVCKVIESEFNDCECSCEPTAVVVSVNAASKEEKMTLIKQLEQTAICGIEGITAVHVQKTDDDEFFIVTEGSNLKKVLGHPLVDTKRVYTNDIWETHECLGIAATRRMLLNDIKKIVDSVNECHLRLLVDRMTLTGTPLSMTRYTMRKTDVGPLSKSTYEQSVHILSNAAFRGETDFIDGISAAIVTGNRIKVGTGLPEILIDIDRVMHRVNHSDEPDQVYY